VQFDKYEGLGNDFLIVDRAFDPRTVTAICDRHRGVGGDGVLWVGVEHGRPFMRVRNADGSAPQMCGNGIRCAALYLARHGHAERTFEIDTDAGPHTVELIDGSQVRVVMRAPSLAPRDLPLESARPWIDEAIEVAGRLVRVTAVSMGNPHAVIFDDAGEREVVGPALERDPRFRERVNVGFASRADGSLDLKVWERGVGWTMACGTGACAAAVAAVETGRAERGRDILVRLPGGPLTIRVGAPGAPVEMTGPARYVFSGTIEPDDLG
jgi:diaminopimelate epimerase